MTTVNRPGEPDRTGVDQAELGITGVDQAELDKLVESVELIEAVTPGLLVQPSGAPEHWYSYLDTATRERPAVTVLTALMAIPGIYALILGANASQAFTNLAGVSGASLIAHILGTALFVGSALGIIGLTRDDRFIELMGLVLIVGGATMYAAGVLLGLGEKGGMAALFAGIIAAALTARTVLVLSQIPRRAKRSKAENGG